MSYVGIVKSKGIKYGFFDCYQGCFERGGRGRYGGIRFGFRRARSRLYRSQILQVNTRWKALAEIYTMHSFAPFSNLNFFVKNCWIFCWFLQNVAKFARMLLNFCWIFAKFDHFFFGMFLKCSNFHGAFTELSGIRGFIIFRYFKVRWYNFKL